MQGIAIANSVTLEKNILIQLIMFSIGRATRSSIGYLTNKKSFI